MTADKPTQNVNFFGGSQPASTANPLPFDVFGGSSIPLSTSTQSTFDPFSGPRSLPVNQLSEVEQKEKEKQEKLKISAGGNLAANDIWVKGGDLVDLSNLGKKKEDNKPAFLKSTGPSLYINK